MDSIKILGIDFGTKRVGLALTDDEMIFAYTIPLIKIDPSTDLIAELKTIIEKNKVTEIVVGMPSGIDLKPTQMGEQVKEFIEELKLNFDLKISEWNEVMTTKSALQNTKSQKHKRKNLDSESARIILQEFLDYKKTGI
jgi:putative Holliday junction resolvase